MKKIVFAILNTVIIAGVSAVELPAAGAGLFADDFSTALTFAEQWTADGDTTTCDGRVVVSGKLEMHYQAPEEFHLAVDVYTPKLEGEGGKAGVKIGGVECIVPCDGAAHKLVVTRRVADGKATYVWGVDGGEAKLVQKEAGDTAAKSFTTIAFVRSGIDSYSIDNVVLSAIKVVGESPNVIINSSMEEVYDDFPYYVTGPNRVGGADFMQRGQDWFDVEKAFKAFTTDKKDKHSGERSLRLSLVPECKISRLQTDCGAASHAGKGSAWVFSAWIKGDRNGIFVKLQGGGTTTTVQVTTEWQRYEHVFFKKGIGSVILEVGSGVTKNADNVVIWVDDIQSEVVNGSVTSEDLKANPDKRYATEYQPCSRDKKFFAKRVAPERAPSFSIPKLPDGVKPTLDFDSWKNHAVTVDRYYAKGLTIPKRTESYLAVDDENLYIAQRYWGDKLEKHLESNGGEQVAVQGTEIFISPFSKNKWIHFGASARGSYFDVGYGEDKNWNAYGKWTVEGGQGPEEDVVDLLIKFPLAFIADPNFNNPFIMNVGRCDCGKDGVGSWSFGKNPYGIWFRSAEYWPEVTLPSEVARNISLGATGVYKDVRPDGSENMLVVLSNNSGRSRDKVRVVLVEVLADGSRPVLGDKVCDMPDGVSTVVFEVAASVPKANVSIYENEKLIFERNFTPEAASTLKILNKLSFYMNEPEAEFEVSYSGNITENTRGVLECGGVTIKDIAMQPRFRQKMPISTLADGKYEARLTVYDGTDAVAVATDKLVKLPFKPGASQINHFSRAVELNGKPTILLALFRHPGMLAWDNPNDLIYQKSVGFRNTHLLLGDPLYWRAKSCITEWLDMCAKENMPVLVWYCSFGEKRPNLDPWPQLDEEGDFPRLVKFYEDGVRDRGWTNIIARQIFDEPELDGKRNQKCVEEVMNRYREVYPYQPVMMNNSILGVPSNYANLNTDIFMIDDYICNRTGSAHERTVYDVLKNFDVMWEKGRSDGRPVWFFMEGTASHGRDPTYDEQIAESYGALASGCTGLSYFCGWISTPGNWRACKQLAREVGELEPVLTSDELLLEEATVSSDIEHVRCRTKLYNGYLYLITCNIDDSQANGIQFSLPKCFKYDGDVEVMFEKNRKIKIRNGTFTDSYAPLSRHVYRVKVN